MESQDTDAPASVADLQQALWAAHARIAVLEKQRAQRGGDAEPASTRFQALFEHALHAILIADDDGRYVDANPAAADLFGVSREELIGKTAADFGPPELDFGEAWQTFLRSQKEQGEFPVYRPNGKVRYAEYAAVPNFVPGRHLSILRDVTEHKAKEAERQRLLAELQALATTLEERVKVRTAELERRSEQLHAVASALAVAEQRERERISQILHDDLQQLLHAAQLRLLMLEGELEAVDNQSIREGIAELDRLNDRALTVARSLTVELRPPVLEAEGLAEALAWLAGHMESVYGLQVALTVADDAQPATVELRELAFQMVRELLFNVVKHAEVEQAHVKLSRQGEQCVLVVADEGSGFDPAFLEQERTHGGYGLWSIRERLHLFDGSLQIEAAPGRGTRVTLLLPCEGAGAEQQTGGDP